MDVVSIFKGIWVAADELAEKDTVQFEKLPYEQRERITKKSVKGTRTTAFGSIPISRTEYKDGKRREYIVGMLEMFFESVEYADDEEAAKNPTS